MELILKQLVYLAETPTIHSLAVALIIWITIRMVRS